MNDNVERFNTAASFTGRHIRCLLMSLPESVKAKTQEIRLRCSRPLMLSGTFGNAFVLEGGRVAYIYTSNVATVSINDVEECFHSVCSYSVHTHQSGICRGYVTVKGGHRVGITGTAVCEKGGISAVRDISSINIRISKEYIGIANELYSQIKANAYSSMIIAGPPSSGKTTVLRDLSRMLGGEEGEYSKTVIIDEREEIAACCNGVPRNDIGFSCDVLSGYPKSEAVLIALRSMSPQNIIIDEIGSVEEVRAIEEGINTGVNFFVTVHADSVNDLRRRPQVTRLLSTGAFSSIALLSGRENPSKLKDVVKVGDLLG